MEKGKSDWTGEALRCVAFLFLSNQVTPVSPPGPITCFHPFPTNAHNQTQTHQHAHISLKLGGKHSISKRKITKRLRGITALILAYLCPSIALTSTIMVESDGHVAEMTMF